MNIRTHKTISDRRVALEKHLSVSLSHIGATYLENTQANEKNCENMIGAVSVPVGIAGPLKISYQPPAVSYQSSAINQLLTTNNQQPTTKHYVPLATTEGALVASVSRGCKSISESGGATVVVENVGVSRGPVFQTKSLVASHELVTWINAHVHKLKEISEKTSEHLTLISQECAIVGTRVYIRFSYDTQDAMGMNMITMATTAMCAYIEEHTKAICVAVAGNYDSDKKPAWINVVRGRGKKTWAEVVLSQNVIKTTLKTTAQRMYDVWLAKCMIGSALAGSMSFTAHTANIIAALFLATGQDMGHVGESSVGMVTMDMDPVGGLRVSLALPDVMVGTVGGGTSLPAQTEALQVLGIAGGKAGANAMTFAGVVCATALAGEISLLASLSEGSLASAHSRLGRGGK